MFQLEQTLVDLAEKDSNKYTGSSSYRARGYDQYYGKPGTQGEKINQQIKQLKHMKDAFI